MMIVAAMMLLLVQAAVPDPSGAEATRLNAEIARRHAATEAAYTARLAKYEEERAAHLAAQRTHAEQAAKAEAARAAFDLDQTAYQRELAGWQAGEAAKRARREAAKVPPRWQQDSSRTREAYRRNGGG